MRNQIVLIGLGTAVCALCFSNSSLWIDEGFSAMMASQPSLAVWVHTLISQQGSDSQMPGYYLYLWLWARLFGTGEFVLRLSNLPWLFFFVCSLAWTSSHILKINKGWLVICVSPFLWAYANEARPYLIIMAFSMTIIAVVLGYLRNIAVTRGAPWIVVSLVLCLWLIHMLTITLIPSLAILAWFLPRPMPTVRLWKEWRTPVLALAPLYLALAVYYFFTIASGRGGQRERPGLLNLAFAFYEFFGMDGLGPPRDMLRTIGMRSLFPYLEWIVIGVIALAAVAWTSISQWKQSRDNTLKTALLWSMCTGQVLLFVLSCLAGFRLLGRHLALFFPFFAVLLIATVVPDGLFKLKPSASLAFGLLMLAWLVSDIRERLLPSYQKDNYRVAVALARAAQQDNYEVLWLADPVTARYYGLPLTETFTPSGRSELSTASFPTKCLSKSVQEGVDQQRKIFAVITNRPYYDQTGECRKIIEAANSRHIATLVGFDIWKIDTP